MAKELRSFGPHDRLCGAEINSIASLIERKYAQPKCGLYFMHSETEQGRQVVEVLCEYYRSLGHEPVKAIEVKDLQDDDPRRFRTKGLRQLVKEISRIIRNHSPAACAINATGGYKAQIAVGVVLGQALGVTIYYKHEQFSEVISFPPLPVALDFELWMRASGMLMNLLDADPVPASRYKDEWDERYESLVERVQIDGEDYLELSPTGQIFHETFTDRFRSLKDHLLPPPASKKLEPRLEKAGWPGEHPEVEQFLTYLAVQRKVSAGTASAWRSCRISCAAIAARSKWCVPRNSAVRASKCGWRPGCSARAVQPNGGWP